MGLVLVGTTILDADGNHSSYVIHLPLGALTLAAITSFAQYVASTTDLVSDGKITSVRATVEVDLPGGLKANPVAGSNVQEGGLVQFDVTGSPYAHSVRVPSWKQAAFTGKEINWGDAGATAWRLMMLNGHLDDGMMVIPCDPHELDLINVVSGKKSFRRK